MAKKSGEDLSAFERQRRVEILCWQNLKKLPNRAARERSLRYLADAVAAEPDGEVSPAWEDVKLPTLPDVK